MAPFVRIPLIFPVRRFFRAFLSCVPSVNSVALIVKCASRALASWNFCRMHARISLCHVFDTRTRRTFRPYQVGHFRHVNHSLHILYGTRASSLRFQHGRWRMQTQYCGSGATARINFLGFPWQWLCIIRHDFFLFNFLWLTRTLTHICPGFHVVCWCLNWSHLSLRRIHQFSHSLRHSSWYVDQYSCMYDGSSLGSCTFVSCCLQCMFHSEVVRAVFWLIRHVSLHLAVKGDLLYTETT